MGEPLYYCVRQRAGPLVKECRALRPRLCDGDDPWERRDKQAIIKYAHSAVCRSQVDRLELRIALFEFGGLHHTLTFDSANLPRDFAGVRLCIRAFHGRCRRWLDGRPFDYIYAIEGKHGDHRYHIHMILREDDLPSAVVEYLWKYGEAYNEPVLRKEGGYRRLAEYLNKESSDGFVIPIGRHPWSCSRGLLDKLPPPERWRDESNSIAVPDDAIWARRGGTENDFGCYYYGSWILPKNQYLALDNVAHARVRAFNLEI